jgi:toxin ParE1/3/4
MGHRLAPEAEADLDDIWLYIARESSSMDVADRLIDSITQRFWTLAQFPFSGRRRQDLRAGLRSFPVGQYVIFYRLDNGDVLVLRVLRGSRDPEALLP